MSKKIYLLTMAMAVVLLSALGFASCVSETETLEGDTSEIVTRGVTFNIQLPSGDAVHVTRAQDAAEYTLKSLYVIVFDAASDKLISKSANLVGNEALVQDGTNGYQYTYTANSPASAARIVLVANDDMAGATFTVGTTTYDYMATLNVETTAFTADCNQNTVFNNSGANGLPMFGVAKTADGSEIIPLTNAAASQVVTVLMTRCVARLDLVNKVSGLTITDIKMKNINSTGYLMPHISEAKVQAPAVTRFSGIEPYTALAGGQLVGDNAAETPASAKNLKSFYLYEEAEAASAASGTYPIMQITGTLNDNIPVFYEVPFLAENLTEPGSAGKRIEIKRNFLYTLEISGTPTLNSRVNMTLKKQGGTNGVDGWGASGNDATDNEAVVLNADALKGAANYTAATHTFTLDATTPGNQTIQFVDGMTGTITGVEVMLSGESSWKAATVHSTNTGTEADWLRAQFAEDGQTATLAVADNAATAARFGSVRVTYTYTVSAVEYTKKFVFTVKQNGTE